MTTCKFRLVLLALLAGAPLVAAAMDKMKQFHALCTPPSVQPISTEVGCLHAMVNSSSDSVYNRADAATELFLLKADRLSAAADSKKITQSTAHEKLLQMLLALEDSHRSEVNAIQAKEDAAVLAEQVKDEHAAWERSQERQRAEDIKVLAAAQRAAEAARDSQSERDAQNAASQAAIQQQQLQRQMHAQAVSDCVTRAEARSQYAFNARSNCELNSNWWETVPNLGRSTDTSCRASYGGRLDCTSHTN